MIYLIESYGGEGRKYLKIGYAKDISQRMKAYDTHSPEYTLLAQREGDQGLENYLHKVFSKFSYKNEWFRWDQEIIDRFSQVNIGDLNIIELHEEGIDQYLRKLLDDFLLPSPGWYMEIYKNHKDEILGSLKTLSEWDDSIEEEILETIRGNFKGGQEIIERWVGSLNPRELLLSDPEVDSLAVDISMDLPQILGRERLDENPWKNCATFFYRTTCDYRKVSKEVFEEIIDKKIKKTNNLLLSYNSTPDIAKKDLAEKYLKDTKVSKYKDDYIAVNRRIGNSLEPVFNSMVKIAEQRAFDIQQVDYKNRFSVFCSIKEEFKFQDIEFCGSDFIEGYEKNTQYVDRLKYLCEYSKTHTIEETEVALQLLGEYDKVAQHFRLLGPNKLYSLGYNITRINKELGIITFNMEDLNNKIYQSFLEGEKYTNKNLKLKISQIYYEVGYSQSAKANDIEKWFEVKSCKISIDGKREHGIELIKKK